MQKMNNETDSGIDTERKRENEKGLDPTEEPLLHEERRGPEHFLLTSEQWFP